MKKILMLTVLLILLFVPNIVAEDASNRVIISFKDNIDESLVENFNGTVEKVYENVQVVVGELPASALKELEKNKNIISIEEDKVYKLQGQTVDWGITSVNAPLAWGRNFTGTGINIAILDTGIANHEDLHIVGGISIISDSYLDDNGHGTHVAGIIGAKNNGIGTVGIAPNANFYAVKVLDQNGTGYLSDIVAGIDWSISNNIDIINLSLGSPQDSQSLKQAVDKAYDKGILVVAAAGNNGSTDGTVNTVEYPAGYESVIAVSAIDINNKRGSFSATGPSVEVTAPGVNILSTYLNNGYTSKEGTSMAAAYVTGVIALVKEANPQHSHIELREIIQQTSLDLGVTGRDPLYGFGLVQASQSKLKPNEHTAASSDDEDVANPSDDEQTPTPSADEYIKLANSLVNSSDRLAKFIEGYLIYPDDKRFIEGINRSARSLLNWASNQHLEGNIGSARIRYERILDAPALNNLIKTETENKLEYARQGKILPSANNLVKLAQDQSNSSDRLMKFIEGFYLYPEDKRFEEGINTSARSLLNWASNQHLEGNIGSARIRYERILEAPVLNSLIKTETEIKLEHARQGKIIPSANNLVKLAKDQANSSDRLMKFIEGFYFYPEDKRFEEGINSSARSLLNWASNQHLAGNLGSARIRYERILEAPALIRLIKRETDIKLDLVKQGKIFPSANDLVKLAQKQSNSSNRLGKFIEGYYFYPEDKRFEEGINSSARSLLNWASDQHVAGNLGSARIRYELILEAPILDRLIEMETNNKLVYISQRKVIPSASRLLETAKNQSSSSARLEKYIEGYYLYPVDLRFEEGINSSAQSLFNWAVSQHQNGNFSTAINRYNTIINAPTVRKKLRDEAKKHLTMAQNRTKPIKPPVIKKVVNGKVQNYTYVQMQKDISDLEKMYPDLIQKSVIGKSLDGRDIYAIKLGNGKNEVFVNASSHAREHMTTNVVMKMIDEYAYAYAKGNRFGGFNVREVLDQTSIWFVPMWNPDGVTLVQLGPSAIKNNSLRQTAININRGSHNFASWKSNVRGVDINRQFPVLWDTIANNPGKPAESHYKGPKPLSEPEALAVYDFVLSRNFKTVVAYHSSGEVIYTRNPGHVAQIVSNKTGYPIIDLSRSTSGGGFSDWFVLTQKKPGITPEISPYVGPRPVPVANWDNIWRQNNSVGLIVAEEVYRNRSLKR
jgi:subtilisin family serine protease/murein tripeptide amidase MpaA